VKDPDRSIPERVRKLLKPKPVYSSRFPTGRLLRILILGGDERDLDILRKEGLSSKHPQD
jgi:hypothetical protein